MNQIDNSSARATASEPVAFWTRRWLSAMEESGQRMQQYQNATRELQEAMQQESVRQAQEMFEAVTQISRAVGDATRENSLAGVVSAQPEVLDCVMQMTRRSNQRLLRLTEQVSACTVSMANGGAAAAEDGPGERDDSVAQGKAKTSFGTASASAKPTEAADAQ